MVRKTYSRNNHQNQDAFKHRSSVYVQRFHPSVYKKPHSQHDQTALGVIASPVAAEQTAIQEQFALPPKRPTPEVLLRSDILPAERTHVSL